MGASRYSIIDIDSNIEREKNSIPLELKKRDEELTAVDGPVNTWTKRNENSLEWIVHYAIIRVQWTVTYHLDILLIECITVIVYSVIYRQIFGVVLV